MNDDHKIPEDRAVLYYVGNFLVMFGFLLFFSVIAEGFLAFNSGPHFGPHQGPDPARALVGFVMVVIGGVMRSIGAVGVAGSGIVLDPQRQRREAKPWSKMAGGMLDDALEEVDLSRHAPAVWQDSIKVRCPQCRALNTEDAKFCNQCAAPL